MPKSIRPGDVLADRYRLVDLLVESGSGRFWRAHDRVLERHVALHVIDADDERAPGLLEAARQSATVPDRRLLRVLDADQAGGLCYVVNEWGSGSSLDIMLASDGPFAPRRAAWLVSEVAAYGLRQLLGVLGENPNNLVAALRALLVTGLDVGLFVVMARFLHLSEVTEVVDMVSQRLPTRRGR